MTEISARDRAIIADYIAGISIPAIASRHRVGRSTMHLIVNAAAERGELVKRQIGCGERREAFHAAVLEMHEAGETNAAIARALGRTKSQVEHAIKCLRDVGALPSIDGESGRAPTAQRPIREARGEILGCRVSVGAGSKDEAQEFLDLMARSVAEMRAARLAGCAA